MKITRLRVAELRRFREPFELAELRGGLNIFTGANEAGKSTLVRAIRAAFFERHKSSSVDDLRPYDDSAATPMVELDFEIAGTPYRLTKSFLQKKRCDLFIGTRRLEGVEAEDALAQQLGFQFASKGANRDELMGIPGLLWIEQGQAQAVRDAALHATDHLRQALDASVGEVAASGGDEVVAQVRKWRDELLTEKGGKPKAALLKAMEDAEAAAQAVADLQTSLQTFRSQVDQLKLLRDAHAADARTQPWLALRTQQDAAQQALRTAQALAGEHQQAQEKLRQVSGLRRVLAQQLADAQAQGQTLHKRESALAAAAAGHEQAQTLQTQAAAADVAAGARWRSAREALALARQEENRRLLTQRVTDAQARATELASLLERALAQHERAASLKREAAQLRLEPTNLAALREQQARLSELRIRQEAVATRLRFELNSNASVALGGEAISGQTERLLVAPAVLTLPGIGQVHIAPGGSDLAELAQAQAQLHDAHRALLQRLGLASLAEAEARHQAHSARLAEAEAADKARKLLAAKGLDALRADRDAALARETEAAAALAQLPPAVSQTTESDAVAALSGAPPSPANALPLDAAERQHEHARAAAEEASRLLHNARHALATAASRLEAAQQERDALKAALDDPQQRANLEAKQQEWVESGVQESAVQTEVSAIAQRIAAARPDILQQDIERFKRSAEEAENQHRARERQIVHHETALAAAEAQGLEEELARAQSESTRAQRRAAELRRRADALQYLLNKLQQRRQALTRRLQAPLQKHLERYLELLFPAGRLEVDDKLVPSALTRPGPRGAEAADFDTLSFGAREQMGVISRLAYADLLKAAGRPTLIILDDALVHSDELRLAQMKRVLFDAAQRHQVLLFTCHPERWRDMGVTPRALESAAPA